MATPLPPINVETLTAKFQTSTLGLTDLLTAVVALAAGFILGAITRTVIRRLLERAPGVTPGTSSMIARICGYVVVVFGLVVALSALGLSFGPVITLLLLMVLVAVLVGRPLLADLGAGVVLQSRRPVDIGDVMRVDDLEGVVVDIDGRVVQMRTFDGLTVRVRNSELLTGMLVSVPEQGDIRQEFVVGVDYGTDLDRAVVVIREAVAATPGVRSDPAPTVLVDEFSDSTINLRCWIWVDPIERWAVKDEAMRDTKRALDADGITIAFPQRVLHTAPTSANDRSGE